MDRFHLASTAAMKPPPEPIVINTNSSGTPRRKPWRVNIRFFYYHVLFHALIFFAIFPPEIGFFTCTLLYTVLYGVPPNSIDDVILLYIFVFGVNATTSICLLLPISLAFPFFIDKNMKGVVYYVVFTLNGAIHAFFWHAVTVLVTG